MCFGRVIGVFKICLKNIVYVRSEEHCVFFYARFSLSKQVLLLPTLFRTNVFHPLAVLIVFLICVQAVSTSVTSFCYAHQVLLGSLFAIAQTSVDSASYQCIGGYVSPFWVFENSVVDLKDVRITKTRINNECWTDHRLVISKMNIPLQ